MSQTSMSNVAGYWNFMKFYGFRGVEVKTLNDKKCRIKCLIFSNFRIANNKIKKLEIFEFFIFDRSLKRMTIFSGAY